MASRLVLPFGDVGGGISPADGAKLRFFDSGTSTDKATYSDENLSTANANPVVADSAGVFPDIWVQDGARYKVRLLDKNDVQIWESDPVIGGLLNGATGVLYDTVSDMKAASPSAGQRLITLGYYAVGDGGGGNYLCSAPASVDGYGDHTLANSNIAVLQRTNGVIDVKQYGAKGDGATDDSANVQAAIDKAASMVNSTVKFPKSSAAYLITAIDIDGEHIHIDALDARIDNASTSSMFILGATSGFLTWCTFLFDRIVNGYEGHVFEAQGSVAQCRFYANRVTNAATTKSIFKCLDTDGGKLYFTEFDGYFWGHSASSTVPAFDIEGSTNTCSANRFTFTRADKCGTAPYFSLKCVGSGQLFYQNLIETSFEVTNGGGVHLFGCSSHEIRNGNFFDIGTTTDDLIKLSSSGLGNECRGTRISNIARNAGTLGSGFYDINLDDANDTYIESSGTHNSGVGVTYNLNSKSAMIINPLFVTYVNHTSDQQIITNDGSSLIRGDLYGQLTIATGAITVRASYHRVDTEASAATDDLDTINGGQSGMRLVLQTVSNGRDVTIKNGTGNIILAGSDFTLDRDQDTIELIYNGVKSEWHELSRSNNA